MAFQRFRPGLWLAALITSGNIFGQSAASDATRDSVVSLLQQGKLQTAREFHSRHAGKSADSYLILAEEEAEEGYSSAALMDFRRAVIPPRAAVFNGIASCMQDAGRFDSVLYYLNLSRLQDSSANNLATINLTEGRYWQLKNDHVKALLLYRKVLDNTNPTTNKKSSALAKGAIAGIYFSHHPDMNDALQMLADARKDLDSARYPALLARNLAQVANCYMVKGNLDVAERNLTRARSIAEKAGNLPVKAYVLESIATLYGEQGNAQKAIDAAEEPIRIRRITGQTRKLQNSLLNISEMYMAVKKYKDARKTLDEGKTISKSLGDLVYLKYFYDRTAMLDSLTGDYKSAYSNLKRSYFYKDSVFSADRIKAVHEISEKYKSEQNQKKIAEKELVIEQQKFSQAIILGASGGGFLILLIIGVILYNRTRLRMQREKQRQDHLRLQSIVNTQEQVQQRIARDLHDGLIQMMGSAKLALQTIRPSDNDTIIRQRVSSASEILDDAVQEARNISHQLLPYALVKDGLVPSLEELLYKNLIDYSFTPPAGEIPPFQEDTIINIYRICQELITNINRHASASHVDITMVSNEKTLIITFDDNGKGFDTLTKSAGAGLANMQTRAHLIGATLILTSKPGVGTTSVLTISA